MSTTGFQRWWTWAPVVGWAVLIFGLSSIRGDAFPAAPVPQLDKLAHVLLYGVFGLLSGRALAKTWALAGAHLVAQACLLAVAYGFTDELHQLLTPHRSCDFRDVVADAFGGLLGGLVAAALVRRRRERKERSH